MLPVLPLLSACLHLLAHGQLILLWQKSCMYENSLLVFHCYFQRVFSLPLQRVIEKWETPHDLLISQPITFERYSRIWIELRIQHSPTEHPVKMQRLNICKPCIWCFHMLQKFDIWQFSWTLYSDKFLHMIWEFHCIWFFEKLPNGPKVRLAENWPWP